MKKIRKEIWKDISGYEGLYQISNLGRVRSLGRYVKCKIGERFSPGRILKPQSDRDGYLCVSLSNKSKTERLKIHRLVAKTFITNPQNKPEVNHKDGNKENPDVKNLEWVTEKENRIHAIDSGLSKSCITKKLTKRQVLNIFKIINQGGVSCKDLAKKYNIHRTTVLNIKNKKIWKHVLEGVEVA